MTSRFLNLLTLSAAALISAHAVAAEPNAGLSRAQVQAELARAHANGDLIDDITGQKFNQIYPDRYPAQRAAPEGKTRTQVQDELIQAQASGELIDDATGLKLQQLYPGRYPAANMQASTHAAERQAVLTGALPRHGQ